jgi:hypothetical protein
MPRLSTTYIQTKPQRHTTSLLDGLTRYLRSGINVKFGRRPRYAAWGPSARDPYRQFASFAAFTSAMERKADEL